MSSPGTERPAMNLPLELHVALTRLDAHLGATRGAIQDLMRCCFPRPPHGLGTVQYRALEDAIHERRFVAAPEPAGAETLAAAAPKVHAGSLEGVPLGIGRWSLREDGWALALPDGSSLALGADERSILLHIARSPEHRISQDELNRLLCLPATRRDARAESSEIHARVINRLRRRTRALGERLPLRLIRGWGYQLARSTLSTRHRSLPMAGAPRASEVYGARKSEEAEMRQ
jgi:DNA-binding response OmpR family regulator